MQCARCNAPLSSESQSCPKCGAEMALPSIIVNQQAGTVNGQMIGVVINYHGKEVTVPSPEAFVAHRAALADKPEYKQWAGAFYLTESGKSLPLYASPYDDEKSRRYERRDLLETIRAHERLLILGEPGMGKTVALQRLMWETATRAEPALTPIFVPLNDFRGDLLEPVRVALCETSMLRLADAQSVRACLERERCLIMFDGVNETPGKWRSDVVAALGNFMREFSGQRYVITSRLQDPLWEKLRAFEVVSETVVIQAITTGQIRDYLVAHLGESDGVALYNRLNERLLELARTPLLLWMIQKIGRDMPELPKKRGKLFELFVEWILEREKKLETETPPEIQKQALRRLAFRLHSERRLVCPRARAEQLAAKAAGKYAPASVMQEALVHHLLEPAQARAEPLTGWQRALFLLRLLARGAPASGAPATDGPQVKFAHQFFQEYFASLDLDVALQAEKQMPTWLRWWLGNSRLAARARDAWWMETFVQLAGLTGDAEWLVLELTRTGNSFLAWWCIDEGGQVTEATRRLVEQNSVGLLQASKPGDRQRVVTALARVSSDRVLPLLLFAAGDEEVSVFNLAMQALLEREEAAQAVVKQALSGEDRRLWQAALRCLRHWPEHSLWVEVPAAMWDEYLEIPDRRNVVTALAGLGGNWAVQKLFYIAGDGDLETANLAVQALEEMGDTAQPLVKQALNGEDRRPWRAALRCLRHWPEDGLWAEVSAAMWDELLEPADRRLAVKAWTRLKDEWALEPLWKAAGDIDLETANLAAQALAGMGKAAQSLIAQALISEDRRLWWTALQCLLARLDNSWAAQAAFRLAGDDDLKMANLAVQVLTKMGEAAHHLVEQSLSDEDPRLWRAALRYLAIRPNDPLCAEIPDRVWNGDLGQSMVWISPGSFAMGSDESKDTHAMNNELPQHIVMLSGYWIGRNPVTVIQWRAFVNASGHKPDDVNSLKGLEDHPVVCVSWHDAMAFCRWWSEKSGLTVNLPSEAEWEKAARGIDGRLYPWGDEFDQTRCNSGYTTKSGIHTTTCVGKYSPQGDSPYGCVDMVGNVWEWTNSSDSEYPYHSGDGREDPPIYSTDYRVTRGGSWASDNAYARVASRSGTYCSLCRDNYGFRVVVRPSS